MKRNMLLVIMLLFALSGCKEINRSVIMTELSSKVDDFIEGSDQFEIEATIKVTVEDQDKKYHAGDTVSIQFQKEPYYAKLVNNADVMVESLRGSELTMYTYNTFNHVDGVQLYEKSKIQVGSSENLLYLISADMGDVSVKKISSDHYEIKGKVSDFLPDDIKDELINVLIDSGLTRDEINSITVENIFKFEENTFSYKVIMNEKVGELSVKTSMEMIFSYTTFEPIDFTDDTKYYPLSSNGTLIPIDASKPILFRHSMPYDTTYYTYLEPGRYGITSNGYDDTDLSISIYDDSLDKNEFRIFKDIYDTDILNPHNISHFYDIKEAGYYYLDVHYPFSYGTFRLDIVNVDADMTWLDADPLVVSESGTYKYQIDSRFDFYSIKFDLEADSIIFITASEDSQIYRKDNLDGDYISVPLSDSPVEYFYKDDSTLYVHDLNHQGVGSITFDIRPLIHSTDLNEPLVVMKDYPNDEYLYSGNRYPNQYVKLEVTETALYTFQTKTDVFDGIYPQGELYNSSNQLICRINGDAEQILTPGTYYYKTLNTTNRVYSIYYTKNTSNITQLEVNVIEETDEIGDLSPIDMPHFEVTFQKRDEVIVATFELTEPKEVVFGVNKHVVLFDETGKKISLSNLTVNYFNYSLDSGKYYILITQKHQYESSYYPYTNNMPLGIFTGGQTDDATYGSYPSIPIGDQGLVLSYDYPGDIDGGTFTLTENSLVYVSSSSNMHIYFGDILLRSNVKSFTFVLDAGTYTIISSGYPDDFNIVVVAETISD